MAESTAQVVTGTSPKSLLLGAAGAAVATMFIAPRISAALGISVTVALILAGIAIAMFAGKIPWLRKAGQGAAAFGITSVLLSYAPSVMGNFAGNSADALFA